MFILFFTLFFLSLLTDAKAEENFNQHSSLEIVPKDYLLKDKNYFYFGVKIILEEGWKTYWKNPGEAWAPMSIDFNDNSGILEKEILFPFPKKFTDYEIETIGYENEIIFPNETEVWKYWSSHNMYDEKIEDKFKSELVAHFPKEQKLVTTKVAVGLLSKKI